LKLLALTTAINLEKDMDMDYNSSYEVLSSLYAAALAAAPQVLPDTNGEVVTDELGDHYHLTAVQYDTPTGIVKMLSKKYWSSHTQLLEYVDKWMFFEHPNGCVLLKWADEDWEFYDFSSALSAEGVQAIFACRDYEHEWGFRSLLAS
jgi:hypothetical protein